MSNSKPRKMTFGLIVGNRGFFPGHLAQSGRTEMIAAIEKAGHDVVAVGPEETTHGAVESLAEASRLAELFRKHSDKIDGFRSDRSHREGGPRRGCRRAGGNHARSGRKPRRSFPPCGVIPQTQR